MRSQSRFNKQLYLRLHALEALMDRMLDCIKEVHQRSLINKEGLRDMQEIFRNATTLAVLREGNEQQGCDVPSEAQEELRIAQKLAQLLGRHIGNSPHHVAANANDRQEGGRKPEPEQLVYVDAPEHRHVNEEIFTELEESAKQFKESRVPKLIFPDGSVQQAHRDHRGYCACYNTFRTPAFPSPPVLIDLHFNSRNDMSDQPTNRSDSPKFPLAPLLDAELQFLELIHERCRRLLRQTAALNEEVQRLYDLLHQKLEPSGGHRDAEVRELDELVEEVLGRQRRSRGGRVSAR